MNVGVIATSVFMICADYRGDVAAVVSREFEGLK